MKYILAAIVLAFAGVVSVIVAVWILSLIGAIVVGIFQGLFA